MKWFRGLLGNQTGDAQEILRVLQSKFAHFLELLEHDNRVHALIGELEEKSQGEIEFDTAYLRDRVGDLRTEIGNMIEAMIAIGGDAYLPLRSKLLDIRGGIEMLLPQRLPLSEEAFTLTFDELSKIAAPSVGNKCIQLAQIRSRLGLPVPDGFAITGWACHRMLYAHNLYERIRTRITHVDINDYTQLQQAGDDIRAMVAAAGVPDEVGRAITRAAEALQRRSEATTFSVRSSAVGEDTHYSFAGQYATYLNVNPNDLIDGYRNVIASQFTPQALYYLLRLAKPETELTMGVGCVAMIDARASGVIYTRDPVNPAREVMLINAVFGLGEYLVDGTVMPDSVVLSRSDGHVMETRVACKSVKLVLNPQGGTMPVEIATSRQYELSVTDSMVQTLFDYAARIERAYHCPQDIEWAVDQSGRVFILQARPLRVVEPAPVSAVDIEELIPLVRGAITICPGAGGGPVYHARSIRDLPGVPDGAVLVAPHTFPGLVTVMQKVSAIVTETGGVANHMATIAREYQIPALSGVVHALESLRPGQAVTVDATKGMIYDGYQERLVTLRRPPRPGANLAALCTLNGVLKLISPLGLVHPGDDSFAIENCRTLHDLTRFCHQRAMEEMFYGGLSVPEKERVSVRLQTSIPLQVNVIYIDQILSDRLREEGIDENSIDSAPMQHFWSGVRHEGWPARPLPRDFERFRVFGTSMQHDSPNSFSEASFAILSREYMIVGLRMGYHFTTVEAMCTEDSQKNYIRMQYTEGGATPERRERRINLIKQVLGRLGFEHQAKGDFLDTRQTGLSHRQTCENLFRLGQLTMLTKQLDMALTNDKVARWHGVQIMKKLGLE
ncbi:MAG: PEP/pyruvate-binding domain-containing protein [Candidatus Zixiibacteriota bacterium]